MIAQKEERWQPEYHNMNIFFWDFRNSYAIVQISALPVVPSAYKTFPHLSTLTHHYLSAFVCMLFLFLSFSYCFACHKIYSAMNEMKSKWFSLFAPSWRLRWQYNVPFDNICCCCFSRIFIASVVVTGIMENSSISIFQLLARQKGNNFWEYFSLQESSSAKEWSIPVEL